MFNFRGLDDGKIYRKSLYLIGKSHGSVSRCSVKPIQCIFLKFTLGITDMKTSANIALGATKNQHGSTKTRSPTLANCIFPEGGNIAFWWWTIEPQRRAPHDRRTRKSGEWLNTLSIGKVIRIHIPLIIGILHSAEHQQHRTDRKVKSFYELERSIFDFWSFWRLLYPMTRLYQRLWGFKMFFEVLSTYLA